MTQTILEESVETLDKYKRFNPTLDDIAESETKIFDQIAILADRISDLSRAVRGRTAAERMCSGHAGAVADDAALLFSHIFRVEAIRELYAKAGRLKR